MIGLAFIRNNWQALAIIAIAGVIFMRIHILKSERDDAIDTIAEMHQESLKKNTEVALLKQQGKRDSDALQASYDSRITELLEINANDKKTIANYRNQLANSLRDKAKDYHDRLPVNDADTIATSDSNATTAGEESLEFYRGAYIGCQTYVETLEKAGIVCATDYNACKSYVDQEQKRIGVYLD